MEILSNIHWIEGINAHSYIVNGDHITIIDTGMPGNEGKILNYVKKRRLSLILAEILSKWYVSIVLGIFISNLINLFINFPFIWNLGINAILFLIILILLLLQFSR